MKNKFFILLCLGNINFIQTETPVTPEMRAAALAELKQEYLCYVLIYNSFMKEKCEKTRGSFAPECITKIVNIQPRLNNGKCDKYQNEIYSSLQTDYEINAFDSKKNEELTIEELHKKEAAEIAFQINFLKNQYKRLRICKEFNISQEEINKLPETVHEEIFNILSENN